jgi:hypothetical protein
MMDGRPTVVIEADAFGTPVAVSVGAIVELSEVADVRRLRDLPFVVSSKRGRNLTHLSRSCAPAQVAISSKAERLRRRAAGRWTAGSEFFREEMV